MRRNHFQIQKKVFNFFFNGCREWKKTRPVELPFRKTRSRFVQICPPALHNSRHASSTQPLQHTHTEQPTGQPALHLCLPDTLAAERREVGNARARCLFGSGCVGCLLLVRSVWLVWLRCYFVSAVVWCSRECHIAASRVVVSRPTLPRGFRMCRRGFFVRRARTRARVSCIRFCLRCDEVGADENSSWPIFFENSSR